MCGTCGLIVHKKRGGEDYKDVLRKMTQVLAHRGPDSNGYYYSDNGNSVVGLGHRRLSIIDLSDAASQPMENEDGSINVVYNGEIYNYREQARELKAKGHKFRSNSDTEVIVHLYEGLGDECVEKLDGMFAFGLWDRTKNRLLLARDRIGIKPLFYAHVDGNFYFASEIKALLTVPEICREIDFTALDAYFTYGYVPGSRTIFKDIKKLSPASYLTFENRQIQIKSYWSIEYLPKHTMSEEELNTNLLDILSRAVKRHLVSDVPLGVFLSGGVDSSIIVALMNMVGERTVDTFSLGYASGGKDELSYAQAVSKYYKTNHHQFKIIPEMTKILPELLWHLDEPFFDNSIIPTWYISKLAKGTVKVALSGDGGDEMFGGYEWARRYQYNLAYGRVPSFLRKLLKKVVPEISPEDAYGTRFSQKARRLLNDLNTGVEEGFYRRTTVSLSFRRLLYSQALKENIGNSNAADYQHRLFLNARVADIREKMLYADTMSYLPDDCLFKVDRMSMAHGLEVRVPFLDKRLVEFAARIPFEHKIRGLTSKYILKRVFEPYVPKEILKQRKQGFTIPISSWLKRGLGHTAQNILFSETFDKRGLFERKFLKRMLEEHLNGKQEFGHRIWSLVIFEVWARLYLDEKIASAPRFTLEEMIA